MERFVYAQTNYSKIVRELKNAKKETHWMWFIFPQLDGLVPNPSHMSKYYAIKSGNDAKEFLKHPILGKRLVKVTNIILKLEETNPEIIFGKTDSVKLQSSLTLFDAVGRHLAHFQLHLYFFSSCTFATFAATPFDVKTESTCLIASDFRFR